MKLLHQFKCLVKKTFIARNMPIFSGQSIGCLSLSPMLTCSLLMYLLLSFNLRSQLRCCFLVPFYAIICSRAMYHYVRLLNTTFITNMQVSCFQIKIYFFFMCHALGNRRSCASKLLCLDKHDCVHFHVWC